MSTPVPPISFSVKASRPVPRLQCGTRTVYDVAVEIRHPRWTEPASVVVPLTIDMARELPSVRIGKLSSAQVGQGLFASLSKDDHAELRPLIMKAITASIKRMVAARMPHANASAR